MKAWYTLFCFLRPIRLRDVCVCCISIGVFFAFFCIWMFIYQFIIFVIVPIWNWVLVISIWRPCTGSGWFQFGPESTSYCSAGQRIMGIFQFVRIFEASKCTSEEHPKPERWLLKILYPLTYNIFVAKITTFWGFLFGSKKLLMRTPRQMCHPGRCNVSNIFYKLSKIK